MALLHQFFSLEELKSLDLKQLELIKAAIQHEIRTSPAVRDALRARVRNVFNQLKGPDPGSVPPQAP